MVGQAQCRAATAGDDFPLDSGNTTATLLLMSKTTASSKTGSLGQTLDGLRVAVSVNWGEFPAHMTRQIIVTVGKLRVYEAQWCDTSRLAAVAMLEKILAGCDDSILADFRRFLGEVML